MLAGQIIALGTLPAPMTALFGFLTGFCVSGAAMISNDYFDLEVDRINHPSRPLPSGRVTPRDAIALTAAFSAAGLAAALALGALAFSIAVAIWFVGIAYNWKFKESGLFGNIMVGFSVGMTFIFGGLSVGNGFIGMVLVFGLLAFIFDLGEEIAGGAMDMEGDKARQVKSVAALKGEGFAMKVSGLLFISFVLITFMPYVMGWIGQIYLLMVIPTDCVAMYLSIKLLRSRSVNEARKAKRQLYLCIIVFVIAFMVSVAL